MLSALCDGQSPPGKGLYLLGLLPLSFLPFDIKGSSPPTNHTPPSLISETLDLVAAEETGTQQSKQ